MKVQLRPARDADVPTMAAIEVEGFHQGSYSQAMFPEHLRTKPGTQDQLEWRASRFKKGMANAATHYIVATVEDESGSEAIAGFAEWVAPRTGDAVAQPVQEKTPEEREEARQRGLAALPVFMDRDAILRADEEINQLMKVAMPLFGDKKLGDMWTLNAIAVSAPYRSKGIGKMLTRWGMEAADANGENVWLVSGPGGRTMYHSLGFKELAKGSRMGEGQYIMILEKKSPA